MTDETTLPPDETPTSETPTLPEASPAPDVAPPSDTGTTPPESPAKGARAKPPRAKPAAKGTPKEKAPKTEPKPPKVRPCLARVLATQGTGVETQCRCELVRGHAGDHASTVVTSAGPIPVRWSDAQRGPVLVDGVVLPTEGPVAADAPPPTTEPRRRPGGHRKPRQPNGADVIPLHPGQALPPFASDTRPRGPTKMSGVLSDALVGPDTPAPPGGATDTAKPTAPRCGRQMLIEEGEAMEACLCRLRFGHPGEHASTYAPQDGSKPVPIRWTDTTPQPACVADIVLKAADGSERLPAAQGRNSKLETMPGVEDALAGFIELGVPIGYACAQVGIAEQTYHKYIQRAETGVNDETGNPLSEQDWERYRGFREKMTRARATKVIWALERLKIAAETPSAVTGQYDTKPVTYLLDRTEGAHFKPPAQRTELTGADGGPVSVATWEDVVISARDAERPSESALPPAVVVSQVAEGTPTVALGAGLSPEAEPTEAAEDSPEPPSDGGE